MRSASDELRHFVRKQNLCDKVSPKIKMKPNIHEEKFSRVISASPCSKLVTSHCLLLILKHTRGLIAAYRHEVSRMNDPIRRNAGASGHLLDFQAKGSAKTLSSCALTAALKRNDVKPMISQLEKK